MPESRTSVPRFVAALVVSAIVVLSAPYLGLLRARLREAFPGHFALIVGGVVGVTVAAALVFALVRIRRRRAPRFAAIGGALAVALCYIALTSTGIPEVDAVERVHFVEYGLITGLFYAAWRRLGDVAVYILPVLAALIVGTLDEWLQWFIPNRVGEAADVLLNAVAIGCGLAFTAALEPPSRFAVRLKPGSRRLIGIWGALAVAAFAGFVSIVHIGHVIAVDGVGEFRSRYTHEQLLRLSADRAERWRADPPLVLRRLSREDQYLDEGLWHVRARNTHWREGGYGAAWRENRLLEIYFTPVLDTKTFAAPGIHRWPPEQRADAEARAAEDEHRIYVSAAEPFPIVNWSQGLFWSLAALLILGCLAFGFLGQPRSSAIADEVGPAGPQGVA